MENIRYGRLDATDEEVIAAAKAAQDRKSVVQGKSVKISVDIGGRRIMKKKKKKKKEKRREEKEEERKEKEVRRK